MAYAPIALTLPQYEDYPNWWMKAYEQGTTTPLSIATDSTGGTLAAKIELNVDGFPVTAGAVRFIPFINGDYDLWLFPTAAEADANDTTNAIQLADNVNADPKAGSSVAVDKRHGVEFINVAGITSATPTDVAGNSVDLQPGMVVVTLGYTTSGDGGGAKYLIKTAAQAATDGDVINELVNHTLANGYVAILQVNASGIIAEQCGAVNDGVTDSILAITAGDLLARTKAIPFILTGDYRTTTKYTVTCQTLITNKASITKDLDDTEAVRFQGAVGGAAGRFVRHIGDFTAGQSSQPTALQTSAHAFVFDDVIQSQFGTLRAARCAYSFFNDTTAAIGLSWGNFFEHWSTRGCVQGHVNWSFPGSGANTENYVATAYLNGKSAESGALLAKESNPLVFNNCEGFTFGTLNIEWTEPANGDHFILLQNGTTFSADVIHFEGNELNTATDTGIFSVSNGGTVRDNINVGNFHINSFVQTLGTLSMVFGGGTTEGTALINSISGQPSTNTFTDFRVIDYDGPYCTRLGPQSAWEEYFTQERKGGGPSDFTPQIYFGSRPWDDDNFIQNPGATINVGKASYIRLTGTPSASLATISATSVDGERHRLLTIENDAGTLTITSTGNINKPADAAWDLTVANNRRILVSLNIADNKADIIGYT